MGIEPALRMGRGASNAAESSKNAPAHRLPESAPQDVAAPKWRQWAMGSH